MNAVGFERGDAVGHTHSKVIVGMDAKGRIQFGLDL